MGKNYFKNCIWSLLICSLFLGWGQCVKAADFGEAEAWADVSGEVYSKGGIRHGVLEDAKEPSSDQTLYLAGEENRALAKSLILAAIEADAFDEIDVAAACIHKNNIKAVMQDFLNDYPGLFYINGAFKYNYSTETQLVTKVKLTAIENYHEKSKQLQDKATEILTNVSESWTELDKALYLHDYIATHVGYAKQDYQNAVNNMAANGGKVVLTTPNVYDAYGALVNGVTVCQGYSEAYKLLLDRLGIPCEIVDSDTMNHAWNQIQINGNWYHVDITWDDPTWNLQGRVLHTHFLASDEELENELWHMDWMAQYACTDDTYRTYWWDETDRQIILLGGSKYYWLTENGECKLTKRTGLFTDYIMTVPMLHWESDIAGNYYDANPSLAFYAGKLYYNDINSIYSLNPENGEKQTVYTYTGADGAVLYGMMVYENGEARITFLPKYEGSPQNDNYTTVRLGEDLPVHVHIPVRPDRDCMESCGCTEPGCTYVFEPNGHNWNQGIVIKEATVFEEGVREFTCKNNPEHSYTIMISRPEPPRKGFAQTAEGMLVYFENGEPAIEKYGFVEVEGCKLLVVNGIYENTISGLYNDPENPSDWYYLADGLAQTQYTGLALYDGAWFYVGQGKLDTKVGGYIPYDGGLFYVAAGQIKTEVNGLAQDPYGTDWYFLANGQVQTQYTGLAFYDGRWFYVREGKLATDYTGFVDYDGSSFFVRNGMLEK